MAARRWNCTSRFRFISPQVVSLADHEPRDVEQLEPPPSPHIFGSGGVWFGDGPVYINLAWKSDTLAPARFSFSKIPIYSGQPWPAKTPVVAEPSYAGAVTIRGRALDATSTPLMFSSDHGPTDRLELQAPHDRPSAADWSFWATGIIVPQAGCYELQIWTVRKSEAIVFEAAR